MNKPRDLRTDLVQSLYKINFHSHTRYSDGANTIREMAMMSKNLGFCCHVITDHYYGKREDLASWSMTRESFLAATEEAEEASWELDFPVIVGAECGYNAAEEINVFGKEAVLYLMENDVSHQSYLEAREKFNCAMILNHPGLTKSMDLKVWEVIDGFERFNSGQDYFKGEYGDKDRRLIPLELKDKTMFSNSDAHQAESLDRGFNLINKKIETENDLIKFIKNGKPIAWSVRGSVKMYIKSINNSRNNKKMQVTDEA